MTLGAEFLDCSQSDSGLTVEESYTISDYVLYVALDCDVQPRSSWSRFFSFYASSPTCRADGVLRLVTDALDASFDPVLTFNAYSTASVGRVSIGEEALGFWCDSYGSAASGESSLVTSVVVYGLAEKPADLTVPGVADPLEVTEDFEEDVYYDADLDRLQATELKLDFCSTVDGYREISWTFEEE